MVEYSSIPLPRTEFVIEDDRNLPETPETKQYLEELRKRQKKRKKNMDPMTIFLDMLKKQKAQAVSGAPPMMEATAGPNRGLGPVPQPGADPGGNPLMTMVKGMMSKDANPMQGSGTPIQSRLMEAVGSMGGNNTQMGAPPAPEGPALTGNSQPAMKMSGNPIFMPGQNKDPMSMLQMLMQMIRGG